MLPAMLSPVVPFKAFAWFLRRRIGLRRVVASISGGKDSAAMSLFLTELGIEHDRVFADTGWEHRLTYEYIRGPLTKKLGPIVEVRNPLGFVGEVRAHGMFPSRTRRFCTEDLKIKPLAAYVRGLDDEVVNAVGIRAAESKARSRFSTWDYSEAFGCDVWRPILTWSEADVIAIHKRHALPPNPLYLMGAERVGCWPCIMATKGEIRRLAELDPERIDEIESLEAEVSEAARQRGADDPRRGMFQARMAEPGANFPVWPIRKVVTWSRTSRGGRNLELFTDPHDGCARWGMCEPGSDRSDPSP